MFWPTKRNGSGSCVCGSFYSHWIINSFHFNHVQWQWQHCLINSSVSIMIKYDTNTSQNSINTTNNTNWIERITQYAIHVWCYWIFLLYYEMIQHLEIYRNFKKIYAFTKILGFYDCTYAYILYIIQYTLYKKLVYT